MNVNDKRKNPFKLRANRYYINELTSKVTHSNEGGKGKILVWEGGALMNLIMNFLDFRKSQINEH